MNPASGQHPEIYNGLRKSALTHPLPEGSRGSGVHLVLMDWVVSNGTVTVLAADDGTASVYLSNGGGFIGGGQKYPAIAEAAKRAVRVSASVLQQASKTEQFDLPPLGVVYFYIRTADVIYLAVAEEKSLTAGTDPLTELAAAMQGIVTAYRVLQHPQQSGTA